MFVRFNLSNFCAKILKSNRVKYSRVPNNMTVDENFFESCLGDFFVVPKVKTVLEGKTLSRYFIQNLTFPALWYLGFSQKPKTSEFVLILNICAFALFPFRELQVQQV